jgi:murein DD-endopeptidase MepM/ murein hydrolase activator NlpD
LESLDGKSEGQIVTKGAVLGQLGAPPVNGDYAPHLHFQVIGDLQGKKGDYPGVSSKNDLSFYKENCPDPNLLLKIR